ncbi:MAG: hypothetical protein K8R36_24115 [Planctomycetales bacterium]|nr:hypothetical protein [Planctomycetales bacterium]
MTAVEKGIWLGARFDDRPIKTGCGDVPDPFFNRRNWACSKWNTVRQESPRFSGHSLQNKTDAKRGEFRPRFLVVAEKRFFVAQALNQPVVKEQARAGEEKLIPLAHFVL